jgi:phasin
MAIVKKPVAKASSAPAPIKAAPVIPSAPTPVIPAAMPKAALAPMLDVAPVAAAAEPIAPTPANVQTIIPNTSEQTLSGARDAQENFRKVVEQSVVQSRAAYDKLKAVAEEATTSLESSYSATSNGVTSLNHKAIDAFKAHSEATLEHVKAVMAAKSIGEAITLQTAHARKQFEALSTQAKEMAELAQKITTDATAPLKATFSKGFAA